MLRDFLREMRFWFWPKRNPSPNIGMLGDMDEVELVEALETTWAVRFGEGELVKVRTLGQLFDILSSKAVSGGKPVEWGEFLRVVLPFGDPKVRGVTRDTELFKYIY